MSKRFQLGKIVSTAGVHAAMEEQPEFRDFVNRSFERFYIGDWGDCSDDDKKLNDESIDTGERLHGVYECPFNPDLKIWIITEWDRSTTTILFPSEY